MSLAGRTCCQTSSVLFLSSSCYLLSPPQRHAPAGPSIVLCLPPHSMSPSLLLVPVPCHFIQIYATVNSYGSIAKCDITFPQSNGSLGISSTQFGGRNNPIFHLYKMKPYCHLVGSYFRSPCYWQKPRKLYLLPITIK